MTADLRIRAAGSADLPAVSRLAGALVRLHHGWDAQRFMLVDRVEEGYAWWFERELGNRDAVILVAEADGAVVGYAYGTVEERDWNALLERAGWVHDVFVDPAARNRGVGRALMQAVVAALEARGVPRVVLLSAEQNAGAQALFASLGFRRTMVEMTRERAR